MLISCFPLIIRGTVQYFDFPEFSFNRDFSTLFRRDLRWSLVNLQFARGRSSSADSNHFLLFLFFSPIPGNDRSNRRAAITPPLRNNARIRNVVDACESLAPEKPSVFNLTKLHVTKPEYRTSHTWQVDAHVSVDFSLSAGGMDH